MSDNIPFEIQTEIIQRISDTKSLIQFRSVSKAWKSVIDSKEFVADHTLRHQAHTHHLLIRKRDVRDAQVKYVSIFDNDDDTFPLQNVFLLKRDSSDGQVKFRQVSVSVSNSGTNTSCHRESFRQDEFIDDLTIVGTSHGLFCLYIDEAATAVIWNPSIRKTVAIPVPNLLGEKHYLIVVGFGVCPQNLDPKLVKITYVDDLRRLQDVNASTQVEVFSLSSGGTWRSPLSGNLPHTSIDFGYPQAVVGRFIYWDAVDRIHVDDEFRNPKLIMSFDLTSEEFTKVNLPDCLALDRSARLSLCNLRESLAVLELNFNEDFNSTVICHVWQMIGHGCTRSFNKLYSISAPHASIGTIVGFRKNGAPIIKVDNDKEGYNRHERALAIYDPKSKSNTTIGVYGLRHTFSVHSYMESLLLLGY